MIRRPRPVPTGLTSGFWEAAARHELAIQRCGTCARWFHPPVPVCSQCHCDTLSFERVSGQGTVYSYTVLADGLDPRFETAAAFLVAAVELDEQPGLVVVSNLIGADPERVQVGDRCAVVFEDLPGSGTLPQFQLSSGTRA